MDIWSSDGESFTFVGMSVAIFDIFHPFFCGLSFGILNCTQFSILYFFYFSVLIVEFDIFSHPLCRFVCVVFAGSISTCQVTV
jgi:hypothetical protein